MYAVAMLTPTPTHLDPHRSHHLHEGLQYCALWGVEGKIINHLFILGYNTLISRILVRALVQALTT